MKRISLFILCFYCFTTIAAAASFDCNKSVSHVEKLICSDNTLAAYDLLLARQYNKTRSSLLDYPRKTLKKEQLAWLKIRDHSCTDTNKCILVYEGRMADLKTIYHESGVNLYRSTVSLSHARLTHIDLGAYIAHMIWVNGATHHINLVRKKDHAFIQTIDLVGDSDNLEYGYNNSLAGKFLTMRDYNKDGRKDLLLETATGSGGTSFTIWLYNKHKQLFNYYGSEQQGHFYPASVK